VEWRTLCAAIDAGVGAVQLRERELLGAALHARAVELGARCRSSGVRFLVNDRADVARAAGADGVQLPAEGLPVEKARALVGAGALIGVSLHRPDELPRATGADFVLFGPVFETPSKRAFGPPQGLERLAEFAAASSLPVCAVGGITVERVGDVLSAGAAGVAVIAAILDAGEHGAARATAALVAALGA